MNERKTIGLALVVFSVIAILALYTVSLQIANASWASCNRVMQGCSILGHIPFESYLGIGALLIMGASGVYMALVERKEEKRFFEGKKRASESVKSLSEEEKSVYEIIKSSDGLAFQNDIIKKTGFSKVKVSRILDRLETKGLTERRRRGMANVVVLKG